MDYLCSSGQLHVWGIQLVIRSFAIYYVQIYLDPCVDINYERKLK